MKNKSTALEEKMWGEFLFIDIFEIKKGFYNKKPESLGNGTIPFLGATANNNGITGYYTYAEIESSSRIGYGSNEPIEMKLFKKNCIAVTNNGSVGHAYYQQEDFTCSHDINPLYLKDYDLNEALAKFLITCIEMQKVCFQYSRKWRPKRMIKSKILLPINNEGNPDYFFMEQYILQKEVYKLDIYKSYISKRLKNIQKNEIPVPLSDKSWKAFFISDFVEIVSGEDIYESQRLQGDVPYVSATANNNGIGYFVGNSNKTLEENCISVNRNGSVGYSFYHPYKALFSNDCRKLRPYKDSKYIGLFLTTQISAQKVKYGYGYKMGTARLKKQKILLPTNSEEEPDFDYMENYMRFLEEKKIMEYLNYLKKT